MNENLIQEEKNPERNTTNTSTEFNSNSTSDNELFKISPQELTNIVNKYKERDENCQDIKYFINEGGINNLLSSLETDKIIGINSLEGREAHFGTNKIFRQPPPVFWEFVKEGLSDKMIIVLICCSIFEILISMYYIFNEDESDNLDWIDGISIIIAVIVVVSVGSVTNYKKEMKFHELNDIQMGTTTYNVIRNGVSTPIISDELLVGDLVKINYGEILPADMVMVGGNGIKIDESSLTGESKAVSKKPFEKCKEEYENKNKNISSNILLSGTNVIEGTGTAIIIAIGEHSQKGIIRGTIDNAQEDNKTPLENKLNDIADLIGYFGLGSAIVTLIALVIQMIVRYCTTENFHIGDMIKKVLNIIILCVSIIVVAIPEGLPLAVTLSLAFSIKKLMDNNNLVRKMHACETMGGANIICTDKTGTLTSNLMFVTRLITNDTRIEVPKNIAVENISLDETKNINMSKKLRQNYSELIQNNIYWEVLYTAIALNVDCIINKLEKADINEDLEICESKNKTDKGFIEFLYQYKSPISVKRDLYLSSPENYKIFPFDSNKKRMTTFVKNEIFPTGYRLFTKGGAENVTLYSSKYIDKKTGDIKPFNEDIKYFINKEIEEMNKEMMRTLYLCYRDITKEEYDNCNNADEKGLLIDQKDLTFIGVFGLRDSLRAGVKEAVKKCHEAGVKVIMVTGDNLITAASIAKECNILSTQFNLDQLCSKGNEQKKNEDISSNEKDKNIKDILNSQKTVMTGNDFYNAIEGVYCQICNKDTNLCQCPKSEAEAEELAKNSNDKTKKPVKKDAIKNMNNFISISKNLLILARSQPIHKYALVLGLKDLGNVVAVTGDGTNDAPALSKSDVGFAMAEGTDIAKEASDIIILDNNFSSIVIAIIYGRSIYENIRKFLQFQLTVNFAACILVFLCSCIGNETPLNSIQMLWVNLIMDSLGSLALATEPPYNELLNKKPTDRNESIINGRMWKHIIFQSILEIFILLILYFTAPKFFPEFKQEINDFAKLVNKCFGQLPGEEKLSNRILYGNKDKWSKDIYLKDNLPESVKLECEVFLRNNRTKWEDVSLIDAYNYNQNIYGGTTHMTLIFDVFVCFTLFNQINCRINDDSFNTFTRINKGLMFCIVTSLELIIQIILSQFGYKVFHCVYHGLTFVQWVICLLLSLNTMSFNLILKLIPFENVIDSWTKSNKNLLNKNSKDISEIGHLLKEDLINDDM